MAARKSPHRANTLYQTSLVAVKRIELPPETRDATIREVRRFHSFHAYFKDAPMRMPSPMRCHRRRLPILASLLSACALCAAPASAAAAPPLGDRLIVNAVKRLQPSVVHIRVKPRDAEGNPLLNLFGRGRRKDDPPMLGRDDAPFGGNYNVGAGIIVSEEGHILTNHHVIRNAREILVKLHQGEEFSARLLGVDDKTDLALLRIEPTEPLRAAPLGDSDAIDVGQWVLAIGSPFGLANSVSVGVISAKGRDLNEGPFDEYLQTDASINPGNSGGPLADTEGVVLGVNTAMFSRRSRAWSLGVGFAIPINQAKAVIDSLRHKGYPVRGRLGAAVAAVPRPERKALGLTRFEGAMLAEVINGGPAHRAGLRRGDVIVEFDGKPVSTWQSLPRMVARTKPDSLVQVKYYRGKRMESAHIRMGSRPEAPLSREAAANTYAGMKVEALTPHLAKRLGLPHDGDKVVVSSVLRGSAAERSGVRPGDGIEEVNHRPVRNMGEFQAAMDKARLEGSALLLLKRKETNLFAAVEIR